MRSSMRAQLLAVHDREQVVRSPSCSIVWITSSTISLRFLRNQLRFARELLERLDPGQLEALDREQRDQADERAHAELAGSCRRA